MRALRAMCCVVAWSALVADLAAGNYPAGGGAQSFTRQDGTVELGDGSVLGWEPRDDSGSPMARVQSAALRLLDREAFHAIGSFKLPNLDPGSVIRAFDIQFGVSMNAALDGAVGRGWSVNFGRVPEDNGTGEGGFAPLPGGVTIAFDAGDGADHPSGIQVLVGGVPLARYSRTFQWGTTFRQVIIHWDEAGLDVTFDGRAVCTDLKTPGLVPGEGDRFAFTARSTAARMDVFLDNVRVATQALPVIDTGGPVISEFVADNSLVGDDFVDKPGWIELMNGSASPVDLTGWYLTDSKDQLTRWRIGQSTLNPYNYLLIFASGRDRQLSGGGWMHTSFTLAKKGGFLALVKPDGKTVASAYSYGPQVRDVSYGEQGAGRIRGFMAPASPGTVNVRSVAAGPPVGDVSFSHPGGFVRGPLDLVLTPPAGSGAEVRYTLDRTEPGPDSALYVSAIPISRAMTVRARAFGPGRLPGPVGSRSFVFMDGTLTSYAGTPREFDSNLPLLFLDSFGFNVDGSSGGARPFRPGLAIVIPPDPLTRRASLTNAPEYAGPCGVHIRGESSGGFDQHSYALELWDEAGADRDVSLLGMPADSDWVLYGPWSEKTLMRNKLVFDWMRSMRGDDGLAVRTRFVELFFNQANAPDGRVGYSAYRGIYVLMEKIKRGKDRVPVEGLNDKVTDPSMVSGGYIIRKDKDDALKNNWTTPGNIALQSFDPDRLNAAQFGYIKGYIAKLEAVLKGAGSRNPRTGYRAYLDPDTFIDAQWLVEIAKQVDGYVFSTYFHKGRTGRLRAGPLWDFNIALGNADYATGEAATGWLYDSDGGIGGIWYPSLHADPEYRLAHWDRYWQLRRTVFSTDSVMSDIGRNMAVLLDGFAGAISNRAPVSIQNPVARHFRRWPGLGVRQWPNPPAEARIRTWQAEVDYMKDWLRRRLEWLDDQSFRVGKVTFRPPVLSHPGGSIPGPVRLVMSPFAREQAGVRYAQGALYFTRDGSDPRLPGGGIADNAVLYSEPVAIASAMTLRSRLYSRGQWSPETSATFLLHTLPANAGSLVISELLYQPADLTAEEKAAGILDAEAMEFLELRNVSASPLDLAGLRFTDGIDFDFDAAPDSARLLLPGESRVLVADLRAFSIRYPTVSPSRILGAYRGRLNNGGEVLRLQAADGSVIQEFKYDNKAPWPAAGDGAGRSLVLRDPGTRPAHGDPASWRLSARPGGTPGRSGAGDELFTGEPARDTDGDGVSDLYEFATGSDPENAASWFPLVASVSELDGAGAKGAYLTLGHRRDPAVRGVRHVIQTSADLVAWKALDGGLIPAGTRTNLDGTLTEWFRETSPMRGSGVSPRFYRLVIQLN